MASSICDPYETPRPYLPVPFSLGIDLLPDEVLNMIFNRLNFHGHLRLSGVCIRWKNLIQNDVLFMNAVRFSAGKMSETHPLVRSYKHVDLSYVPGNIRFGESLHELLRNAETILFGTTKRAFVNRVMPLCKSLKEVELYSFEHDDTVLTFNHPFPVRILLDACPEFLDRFDVITHVAQLTLTAKLQPVPTDEQMAKYGSVIKSLYTDFNSLNSDRFRNMQLEHLSLSGFFVYNPEQAKVAAQSFFEKQAPFIKMIELNKCGFYLNPMLLSNLEKIKISSLIDLDLCLNDLKVVPKLKCLDYEFNYSCYYTEDELFYQLDITELRSLVELRISTCTYSMKLRIISRNQNQSMDGMEKLEIFGYRSDLISLEQIAQTMPRLKVLAFDNLQIPNTGDHWVEAAAQLNKLVHLESLTELNECCLLNDCLENLLLPELRHLKIMFRVEEKYQVLVSEYGQRKKKTSVSIIQTTLDQLAKNCPKLLRIFGTGWQNPSIFAIRLNAASTFRKVRPVRKWVGGDRLRFDYDSVEGCSSDEE